MGQMRGEDQQRFQQRKRQHEKGHHRYPGRRPHQVAGHEKYGHEKDHGADYGVHDWLHHAGHPLAGAAPARLAGAVARVNRLAHNDGVIDHDPENQQEGEQGDHVQTDRRVLQHKQAAEEGDGDTRAHPQGQAWAQKEHEHAKHQDQPAASVFEQGLDTAAKRPGRILPDRQRDPRRQLSPLRGDPLVHDLAGAQHVRVLGHEHRQVVRRATVKARAQIAICKAVDHARHIAEQDTGAVAAGQHCDVLEFGARIRLPARL